MQKLLAVALCAALAPFAAHAEVTGAQVGFDYTTLAEDGMRDINKAALSGSLEYSFGPQFSVQGDIAQRYYGLTDAHGSNFTLHGTYHVNDAMAAGAFVGRDWVNGSGIDNYGAEFSNKINRISYQAAITHFDGKGSDGNGLSLAGSYAMNSIVDAGGRFDLVQEGADQTYRIGGTLGYEITPGLKATGEIGFYDGDNMSAESYIGVGVKATFGANGGTTFAGRSIQDFLPGL